MARIVADPARLLDTVEQMARVERMLCDYLDEAESAVTRLHAVWSGGAAQAHLAKHERWRSAAAQMRQALTVMRSITQDAHDNYVAAVAANVAMWSF